MIKNFCLPQGAPFTTMTRSFVNEADQLTTGRKPYEPSGWSIAIETPHGVVGLWSSWLKNQFYLGYPKDVPLQGCSQVVDELIMEILGVERARPVLQVQATPVGEGYQGKYKDPDKPLVKNTEGQFIGYCAMEEPRLWAKFYSDRVADNKGRVWVDHSDFHVSTHQFDVVRSSSLESVCCGHNHWGISTFPYSYWNEYAPDGPTTEPEIIQTYRDKFLALARAIARQMGGATAMNINYGFLLVPEQLENLGYERVTWLKGKAGVRKGHGDEVVRAEMSAGGEELILKSGNNVPWITVRRVPCTPKLNAAQLTF